LKTRILCTLLLFPLLAYSAQERFYIGTYARPAGGEGIYTATIDTTTGKLSPITLAIAANNANYLALSPDASHLYAITYDDGGSVAAYNVGKDGALTFINRVRVEAPGGCHVSVDAAGKNVLIANYNSGTIVCNQINPDGSLGKHTGMITFQGSGPDASRQDHPYGHFVATDSSGQFVYSCDLGTDHVWSYHFDAATGAFGKPLDANGIVPPGSGPRHLVFGPGQDFAYVNGEMGRNVTTFKHDKSTGVLTAIQTTPVVPGVAASSAIRTAEIRCHPSGKFIYVSSRGDDIVAVFSIGSDGKLTFVQDAPALVKDPRGMNIDPTGQWLITAGQSDSQLAVFEIARDTGKLTSAKQQASVPTPVDILFLPAK